MIMLSLALRINVKDFTMIFLRKKEIRKRQLAKKMDQNK